VATVFSLGQLLTGHKSAEGVAENQPAKLAALEGHFEAKAPADMYIFGWVDQKNQEVTGVKIPGGLSFLIDYDFETPVTGLNAFPEDERPGQVNAVFQFYHIMVAIGMGLIGISLLGCFMWMRGKLFDKRWLLWIFVFAALLPQIANQVGWFAAEMGRQPWVVYGLLRTSDAFSQAVSANQIIFSLVLFLLVYALLFVLFVYLLNKKIQNGPYDESEEDDRPLTSEITNVLTSKKS
jgi:cytochrome d ubiquinol oxidase subunit I